MMPEAEHKKSDAQIIIIGSKNILYKKVCLSECQNNKVKWRTEEDYYK